MSQNVSSAAVVIGALRVKKETKNFTTKPYKTQNLHSERRHVVSNNVAFCQVSTQMSLCSLLLSLETHHDAR